MRLANTPAPSGHRICRHLRCKEMYLTHADPSAQPKKTPEQAWAEKAFWCLKTFQAFGPDRENCGAEECPPSRSCYEA